jgi:arylsulfatase A-like enzyme
LQSGCRQEPPRPRNALVIVLDTLRADALSAYGNPGQTSPAIDTLAARGVLFEQAVTNAPWTLPALVGLLSGRYPTARVYHLGLRVSLVETLQKAGFATAAFTERGYFNPHYGLHRGFDTFVDRPSVDTIQRQEKMRRAEASGVDPKLEPLTRIEETFGAARQWLAENREGPFFLVVHTYETHTPYTRTERAESLPRGLLPQPTFSVVAAALALRQGFAGGETEITYIRALYEGGVAVADAAVGRLLESLAELGIEDETLVVVTSDHGEDLGDREPLRPGSHGHTLYDELLLVPLVIFDPTLVYPVDRVTAQVRTVDTLPTVFDLLGVEAGEGLDGRSLVPLMRGEEREDRPAWSRARPGEKMASLRTRAHKVILNPLEVLASGGKVVEYYDLESDPEERHNLSSEDRPGRHELLARLRALREGLEAQGTPQFLGDARMPESLGDQLRALGYAE